MKKYKLLNTKGLLMGLGATTAIIAPVTTLVACGGNSSHKIGDINGVIKAADTSLINKVMFQSYSGFALGSEMIAENILNSRSEGILTNISRAIDLGKNTLLGGEYNDASKIATLTTGKQASLEFTVNKSDINKDGGFDKIATNFVSRIDKNKQYFATIKSNAKDDAVTNNVHESGSWTISLYEQTNIDKNITDSASLFADSTKFALDEKQVADMGGTYTMATKHVFSESDPQYFIHGFKTTPKESLHDRSEEDHLKSWTGFGPIADTSMTQADKDLLKTVKVTAYPEEDRKTHEWHTVLSIWNDTGVKTVYLNTNFVGKFASNTPLDLNDLKTQLKFKSNFMKFYDFMHANASQLGSLPSLTMPHFIMLANELPTMARLSDLVGDDSFLNDLFAYIAKENPNFDKNTFYQALKNMEDKSFGLPMNWGAKRFSILYFVGQFYSMAHQFIDSTDGAKYKTQVKAITNADDFYKAQKDEKDWNDFVSSHQVLHDSIIKANPGLTRAQLKDKILEQEWNTIASDANHNAHNTISHVNDVFAKLTNNIALKTKPVFNSSKNIFAHGLKVPLRFIDLENEMTELSTVFFANSGMYTDKFNTFINETNEAMISKASSAGTIHWEFNQKSFDENTGTLVLEVIGNVSYKDANGNGVVASKAQIISITGFKTQAEIDAAKLAADQKAAADWAKHLADNAQYLQGVTITGLSHVQIDSIIASNKYLSDNAKYLPTSLGSMTLDDAKALVAWNKHLEAEATHLGSNPTKVDTLPDAAGRAAIDKIIADAKALETWNKYLSDNSKYLGTNAAQVTSLPTDAEKAQVKQDIDFNKIKLEHPTEFANAATTLGFTGSEDSHKAEIIAEANKHLIAGQIQAAIDAKPAGSWNIVPPYQPSSIGKMYNIYDGSGVFTYFGNQSKDLFNTLNSFYSGHVIDFNKTIDPHVDKTKTWIEITNIITATPGGESHKEITIHVMSAGAEIDTIIGIII